ncbi:TonB-dependent siderophore receptor [Bordetella genomosp. 10]|uniref:TonB-dependent siderophore receptor n=1 Tax=Bordetella genomosp. 10 TaxID=1416804 RepID=A0A261SB58_9BORD|nr:TonB-dependent receptor [Bordetella genomosp. 10]OZI34596.1 TonB-dependent siderophore receptor [Bordetella genomosp. 10]
MAPGLALAAADTPAATPGVVAPGAPAPATPPQPVRTNPSAPTPTATLAPVTVTAEDGSALDIPAATGSNLGLTPRQTPASVDTIDRAQLEQRGDANLIDAITRAPGFSNIAHPGNGGSALSVRGFTDSTSVMQLYDGLRQYGGLGVTFPFDTWSIDRIEVLRGPASVIYGEGAIGGVVNVIPKKPTNGPIENEVQATVGTEDTQRLSFGSGGAINDKLSYRFDISGNHSGNWVDMGDSRNLSISGALKLTVSPEFSLTLSHAQGWQQPMRYFGVPLIDGRLDDSIRKKNYNVGDAMIKYDDRWTELSAQWTPNADTTVRTRLYQVDSHRHWRDAEYYTWQPSSGLIQRSSYTEILHDQSELGATSDATFKGHVLGLANQVSVGFDASHSSFKHTNNSPYSGVTYVDPYDFGHGDFINVAGTAPKYRNKASQYAFYGEDRLSLTDKWSVVGGLRYDHVDVSRRDLVLDQQAFDQRYSHTGWRLGTVYDLTPDLSVYGQYAEAADPVSALLMLSPSNSGFSMSTGRQVEIGLKQSFLDGNGDFTLAGYRIVKKNLVTADALDPSTSVQVGKQSSRGIEATLGLTLARDWRLDANATLLRARYDDFTESVGGVAVSRAGNVPANVPERLANVWLSWRFLPQWTASAGLRYVGRRYADRANTLEMAAYTTTDLALKWEPRRDLSFTLRGFNIFDRHYTTTAYYNATQWLYDDGRRVELTMNYKF